MRYLYVSFAALVCLFPATAAPAPLAKRERPQPSLNLVGEWKNYWNLSTFVVQFRGDGSYLAGYQHDKSWWAGTWTLNGRTLTVREWHVSNGPDNASVWRVTLDRDLTGDLAWLEDTAGAFIRTRVEFKLRRP